MGFYNPKDYTIGGVDPLTHFARQLQVQRFNSMALPSPSQRADDSLLMLPDRQVGGTRYRPHYDGAPPQTYGVDGMYPMAPMGPESLSLQGVGPGAASPFQFGNLGPENIPSPEQYAQSQLVESIPESPGGPLPTLANLDGMPLVGTDGLYPMPGAQAAQGADGLYPMPSDRDPMAMAPPYVPGAVMSEPSVGGMIPYTPGAVVSEPSVGPMPGPSSLDTAMADAGGQGEELQRMLDRALQEDFLGGASMPRMSADAGGPQPQGRGARSKPPSKMQQKVMSMFPGGMGEYNAWHNGLPASAKEGKKLNNWSKVYKHLMENPRSAPGAAPSDDFVGPPLDLAGSDPFLQEPPVGNVSSVGDGQTGGVRLAGEAGGASGAWGDPAGTDFGFMPTLPTYTPPGMSSPRAMATAMASGPGAPDISIPGRAPSTPVPGEAIVTRGAFAPQTPEGRALFSSPTPGSPRPQGESPMDYFNEATDFGRQAGLSEEEARSAAFDMARERDPGYWGSYDMGGGGAASPSSVMASAGPPARSELQAPPMDLSGYVDSVRESMNTPLQAPPMDLSSYVASQEASRRDPRSATQQQLDPMPSGVDYSYNMTSPRHLMGGGAASTPYAPSPPTSMGVQETAMAAAGGESALDYFQGAMELGLEAGLSQEQAADEALRMAQNMNPESWSGYELPLTPEEQSRKMRHLKRAAGAGRRRYPSEVRAEEIQGQSQEIARLMRGEQRDYRDAEDRSREIQGTSQDIARLMREENRKKHRSQEEIMMMADRLRDSGTLHAPGPMGSRHTAGYQPLPGMPGEEDRSHWRQLPPLDLYEYRKRMMMEMLLDGTNGGISSDPNAYDPMLGR